MAYFFFFNDTATTEIYTLSLHDALPISTARQARQRGLHCLASAAARELEVDCGGVTASDSAGLAVLLDWLGAMKRSEEHTSELQSLAYLVCRLLLEKKKSHPSHVRIVKL